MRGEMGTLIISELLGEHLVGNHGFFGEGSGKGERFFRNSPFFCGRRKWTKLMLLKNVVETTWTTYFSMDSR